MAKKKAKKVVLKWKKKVWHKIYSPRYLGEKELGETHALDPKVNLGKTVDVSLMQITGNIRHKNLHIKFEIIRNAGSNCHTEFKKYYIPHSSLKRIVSRGKEKIDDSFKAITYDKKVFIFKPLIITKTQTTNSILTAIRKTTKAFIRNYSRRKTYDYVIKDVINNVLQKALHEQLKKIFPIRNVDIRVLELEKRTSVKDKEQKREETSTNKDSNDSAKDLDNDKIENTDNANKTDKIEKAQSDDVESKEEKSNNIDSSSVSSETKKVTV